MLRDFLIWWAEQMRTLLPDRLTQLGSARGANALVVTRSADDPARLDIVSRNGGREVSIGAIRMDDTGTEPSPRALGGRKRPAATVLRTGAGELLERQIELPLAAERDLSRVLRYEMDRLTPFDADEVFWHAAVERRDRARGRLHVRLSLVAIATVGPMLVALKGAGIAPTELEALASDGGMRRIGLAPPDDGLAFRRHRVVMAAVALCCVLALVAIGFPFLRQSLAFSAVEVHIAQLQPKVAAAEAMRRHLASLGAGADVMTAERAVTGDVLQVLASVTELLPDDTVLSDFTLSQGRLGIGGTSSAAARLIPVLAGDPLIHDPAFIAPVTRAEEGGVDRFAIRAELAR